MAKKVLVASIAATLGIAGAGLFYWKATGLTDQSLLLAKCEEVLLDRLRSPATYNRVNATDVERTVALQNDYLYANDKRRALNQIEKNRRDAELKRLHDQKVDRFQATPHDKLSLYIDYDAANAFGTPLRGTARCEAFVLKGRALRDVSMLDPRVDGYTSFEWALDQIEKLGN